MELWVAALIGLAAVLGILYFALNRKMPRWARITAFVVLGILAAAMLCYGLLTLLLVFA